MKPRSIRRARLSGPTAAIAYAVALVEAFRAQRRALVANLIAEVDRRGGETSILHSPCQGSARKRCETRGLEAVDWAEDHGRPLCLLRAEGWRYYSRRFGARPAALAYLAGLDDNGQFAVRVPSTCTTVQAAVDWLTPAEAQSPGAIRQGNVYAVRTARQRPAEQRGRHVLVAGTTRTLVHLPRYDRGPDGSRCHAPVAIPDDWPGVKLIEQRRLDSPRGRTRD